MVNLSMKKNTFAIVVPLFLIFSACAGDGESSLTQTLMPLDTPVSSTIIDHGSGGLDLADPDDDQLQPDSALSGTLDSLSHPDTEFPLLPDAQNAAAFDALFSYESAIALEEALGFYKSELTASGWTLTEEIYAGDTTILLFAMGERKLSIVVAPDPDEPERLSIVIAEED